MNFKVQADSTSIVLQPGGSDSTPAFILKDFNNKSRTRIMRPRVKCTLPLAPITSHALNLEKIIATLKETDEDPILLSLIDRFLKGKEPIKEWLNSKKAVSRHFAESDIAMLKEAHLLEEVIEKITNSIPAFKVPKKTEEGRMIMDCRCVNELYADEDFSMEIDRLEEVIALAEKWSVVWSTDANAYFYQFRLSKDARRRFPINLAAKRGNFDKFFFTALPMGFKFAPAIAQRTSNMVIRRVRRWIAEEGIHADVTAWVDNFIVFAEDSDAASKTMKVMQHWLKEFEIDCKEVDKSGEFLGLKASAQGVCLTEKCKLKTLKAVSDFRNNSHPTHNDFLVVFGHLLWANITVIRKPLCFSPATLAALREAGKNLDQQMPPTTEIIKEIDEWTRGIDKIMKRQPKRGIVKAWSDATPNDGALVQEWDELDIIATTNFTPQQVQIFEAELATAVWGAIAAPGPVDLFIDNTAVAYAIAKGHSTSEKGNALLRLLFTHATVNSVSWVATHLQRADGPSRGDWNLPPRNANVEKKNIVSFFF